VRRSRMSGRRAWRRAETVCARAMGKNISRPKQVTDWVALGLRSSSKCLQRSPTAACSCSQLGSRRMCWPDVCATNSLVRKIPACLCQVHRLLAADRGWGCASAHREAEDRRIPGSSRWVLTSTRGIASTCPLTDNAQGSQARLGPRLMPPQSQLLAYGPASPVNKSLELVLRSRTSPTRRDAQRPGTAQPATHAFR
jgi:hypothetical protein